MGDLVQRLAHNAACLDNEYGMGDAPESMREAAAEIERLREQLAAAEAEKERLRKALRATAGAISSLNAAPQHALTVNDERVYWQREEWVRWMLDEVAPAAIDAAITEEKQ